MTTGKRYINHNTDLRVFCTWSRTAAPATAETDSRCPAGCTRSWVEEDGSVIETSAGVPLAAEIAYLEWQLASGDIATVSEWARAIEQLMVDRREKGLV
jgi:hypothetical protein